MGPIKVRIGMTDEEIDEAIAAAEKEPDLQAARTAQYLRETRLLLICLKSGQRMAFPVEDLEDIKGATDEDLSEVELYGSGTAIHFTKFGHGVYIPALVEGVYGSKKWMEQLQAKRAANVKAAA